MKIMKPLFLLLAVIVVCVGLVLSVKSLSSFWGQAEVEYIVHEVQEGETLWGIVDGYNESTDIRVLLNYVEEDSIKHGQLIEVPVKQ